MTSLYGLSMICGNALPDTKWSASVTILTVLHDHICSDCGLNCGALTCVIQLKAMQPQESAI